MHHHSPSIEQALPSRSSTTPIYLTLLCYVQQHFTILAAATKGPLFDITARVAEKEALQFSADPRSIIHGTYVNDCAEAYVAIAETDRNVVKRQRYDISSYHYGTLSEIAQATVKGYGIGDSVRCLSEPPTPGEDVAQMLIGF